MDSEINKLRIIIAIPSLLQQLFVIDSLKRVGVNHLYPCINLDQADKALNDYSIDIVISSLYFENDTSYSLLQRVSAFKPQPLPFLLLTAENSQSILEPFRQHGVFAILKKPYKDNDLYLSLLDALYFNRPLRVESNRLTGKILIVDDSTMARYFVKRLLIKWGFKEESVMEATNGQDAIAQMRADRLSLIISDYNMPMMNGFELLKITREEWSNQKLPVIMVTSERDEEKLAAINQLGVHCILDKPFSIIQLFHQIHCLFSTNSVQEALLSD